MEPIVKFSVFFYYKWFPYLIIFNPETTYHSPWTDLASIYWINNIIKILNFGIEFLNFWNLWHRQYNWQKTHNYNKYTIVPRCLHECKTRGLGLGSCVVDPSSHRPLFLVGTSTITRLWNSYFAISKPKTGTMRKQSWKFWQVNSTSPLNISFYYLFINLRFNLL